MGCRVGGCKPQRLRERTEIEMRGTCGPPEKLKQNSASMKDKSLERAKSKSRVRKMNTLCKGAVIAFFFRTSPFECHAVAQNCWNLVCSLGLRTFSLLKGFLQLDFRFQFHLQHPNPHPPRGQYFSLGLLVLLHFCRLLEKGLPLTGSSPHSHTSVSSHHTVSRCCSVLFCPFSFPSSPTSVIPCPPFTLPIVSSLPICVPFLPLSRHRFFSQCI